MKVFFEHNYCSSNCHGDSYKPDGAVRQSIIALLDQLSRFKGELSFGGEHFALQVLPELLIKSFGPLPLPVSSENARRLTAHSIPIGRNVWMLPGDQIHVKNLEWGRAIEKLHSAQAGSVQVVAIGPWGYLEKLRDDESKRCWGKLVVHLPSEEYRGGDLVVYEGGKEKCRYDFGKKTGIEGLTAQYAVYATGAESAEEKVVSGFSLVMVYSLCLPRETPFVGVNNSKTELQGQLIQMIGELSDEFTVGAGNATMTLVFSARCTTEEIQSAGVEALSGVDRERFLALKSVNEFLPQDKQLLFYIARLEYSITYPRHCFTSRPKKEVALGQVSWYSLRGELFGRSGSEEWTKTLKLLNSGNDTLGRHEKSSTSSVGSHARFGIVAWPACADIANRYTHMGEDAATLSILSDDSEVTDKIRRFLLFEVDTYQPKAPCVSMALCQKLWKVIAETEELPLVGVFFNWYFIRLESKLDFIPDIARFVQRVGYDGVINLFVDAIKQLEEGMRLALKLSEALPEYPQARVTLTTFALQEARITIESSDRCISEEVGLLWKDAMDCNNDKVCTDLLKVVAQVEGSLLSPYVNQFSKLINLSSLPEHRAAFTCVVDRRRQWLREQVSQGAPSHWEISAEHFPDDANIATFLEGPLVSLVIEGFNSIGAARTRVALLRKRIKGPLDVSAREKGAEAYVQLTKQDSNLKASCTMEITKMDLLLQDLSSRVGDENADRSNTNTTGQKRPRDEELEAVSMD